MVHFSIPVSALFLNCHKDTGLINILVGVLYKKQKKLHLKTSASLFNSEYSTWFKKRGCEHVWSSTPLHTTLHHEYETEESAGKNENDCFCFFNFSCNKSEFLTQTVWKTCSCCDQGHFSGHWSAQHGPVQQVVHDFEPLTITMNLHCIAHSCHDCQITAIRMFSISCAYFITNNIHQLLKLRRQLKTYEYFFSDMDSRGDDGCSSCCTFLPLTARCASLCKLYALLFKMNASHLRLQHQSHWAAHTHSGAIQLPPLY